MAKLFLQLLRLFPCTDRIRESHRYKWIKVVGMFLRIQLLHQVILHGPAGSLLNRAVLIAYIAVESGADRFRIFGILPQQHDTEA